MGIQALIQGRTPLWACCNRTGVANVQVIKGIGQKDVDSELQQLFAERKIKRTSSYSHLRALINSLRTSTGHDLLQFVLPKDVICRPLLSHETRYLHEGLYHLHCGLTNTTRPQLGNLGKTMLFCSSVVQHCHRSRLCLLQCHGICHRGSQAGGCSEL